MKLIIFSVVVQALSGLFEVTPLRRWIACSCKVLPVEGAAGQLPVLIIDSGTLHWEQNGAAGQGAAPCC